MAMAMRTARLTCLCNAAEMGVTLPETPIIAPFCHCTSCRHLSGCLCVTSIPLSSDEHHSPITDLPQSLAAFEFSKNQITHYFCQICGTHMLAHVLPRERNNYKGRWFAMCGTLTLEDAGYVYQPRHEYVADTLDGGFADFLLSVNNISIERWAYHPGDSDQLPLHWKSPSRSRTEPSPTDQLHAYCKCKGVQFWISRLADETRYQAKLYARNAFRLGPTYASACIPMSHIFLDKDGHVPLQQNPDFGTLRTYLSSSGVEKSFCGACGATVFVRRAGEDDIGVAIGLLNAAEGTRAESWLEWTVGEAHFHEDSISRSESLTFVVEGGLREFKRLEDAA